MRKYKKKFKTDKKKSLFKIKMMLGAMALLAAVSGLIYFLLFSSVFKIERIEVLGTDKIPSEEIKKAISDNAGSNIFLANLSRIKELILNSYPEIAMISIRRKMPDILLAEIEERKPVAALVKDGYFILDKEGVAFERSSKNNLNLPEITKQEYFNVELGQKAIDRVEDILKITKKIKTKQATVVSDKRLDIATDEGFDVYFSLEKDIDWQIEQLQALLQEKIPEEGRNDIEYIDLRFDKVFVKKAN